MDINEISDTPVRTVEQRRLIVAVPFSVDPPLFRYITFYYSIPSDSEFREVYEAFGQTHLDSTQTVRLTIHSPDHVRAAVDSYLRQEFRAKAGGAVELSRHVNRLLESIRQIVVRHGISNWGGM